MSESNARRASRNERFRKQAVCHQQTQWADVVRRRRSISEGVADQEGGARRDPGSAGHGGPGAVCWGGHPADRVRAADAQVLSGRVFYVLPISGLARLRLSIVLP